MPTSAYYPGPYPNVLHGQVVEAVDHAKYLGLEISHDLNWNTHIKTLTTSYIESWAFYAEIFRQTEHQGIRQTTYNTLVRPRLEYASPIWIPYTQANINKVEAV